MARAVRTKFARRTSSIPPRISRAMIASCGSASAMTGSTMLAAAPPFQPATGSSFRYSPKNSARIGAVTKEGIAMPVIAIVIVA